MPDRRMVTIPVTAYGMLARKRQADLKRPLIGPLSAAK